MGEASLRDWMADNAHVCWVEHPRPWVVEEALVRELNLPLNLRGNESHQFYQTLSGLRAKCRSEARRRPRLRR